VVIQENTYSNTLRRARERKDTNSLAALQDVCEELDEWARQRDGDLQEHMLKQEEEDDDDEMDLKADGVELDDSEEEAEMEAEGVELGEGDELMGGVDGEATSLRKTKSRRLAVVQLLCMPLTSHARLRSVCRLCMLDFVVAVG
jgi:hypothetical protein